MILPKSHELAHIRELQDQLNKVFEHKIVIIFLPIKPSGSVVECLTRDRGVAGSSLTGVTALYT